MEQLAGSAKAYVAAVIAFLGPLLVLLQADAQLDVRNVLASLVSGIVAGLGVYATRNAPVHGEDEPGRHAVDRRS